LAIIPGGYDVACGKTMSDIEASNAELAGSTTDSIAKPVVHPRQLRFLRRIVTAQATGLVAGFARQARHNRTGSGLGVGAALGLRLFAHDSPPEFSGTREMVY